MTANPGKYFGKGPEGQEVCLYDVASANGLKFTACTYGATLVSLLVPDANLNLIDVVLGFDNAQDYISSIDLPAPPHFGAAIGRYAGRINRGVFSLDGKEIRLRPNNNGHTLHGGRHGYSQRVWRVADYDPEKFIEFELDSPDGDENFPGQILVRARYKLEGLKLIVDFEAFAHADTVINLTQHSYFNLDGHRADLTRQKLYVRSDALLETRDMIPTGKIAAAEDTPFDHREARDVPHEIDATFILNREPGPAAILESKSTGLRLEVETTQPAVHVYVGGDCFGMIPGKGGAAYHRHSGICFETQNYPDAPNHAHFPSALVRKGETYRHQTVYQFQNSPL